MTKKTNIMDTNKDFFNFWPSALDVSVFSVSILNGQFIFKIYCLFGQCYLWCNNWTRRFISTPIDVHLNVNVIIHHCICVCNLMFFFIPIKWHLLNPLHHKSLCSHFTTPYGINNKQFKIYEAPGTARCLHSWARKT